MFFSVLIYYTNKNTIPSDGRYTSTLFGSEKLSMEKNAPYCQSSCPVTGLPIEKLPHWNAYHAEAGYNASFAAIGPDIVYIQAITDNDTFLDYMDIDLFRTVCDDLEVKGRKVFVVFNFKHIRDIRYTYKKDFANLVYNWGTIFSVLVLYNVHPEIRTVVEGLSCICPDNARMLICDSYEDAIQRIIYYKSATDHEKSPDEEAESSYNASKKQFLGSLARICWLDLLDLPLKTPTSCGEFKPFFIALEEFRKDRHAKAGEHRQHISRIQQQGDQQLEHNKHLLNAKLDLYVKNSATYREEKASVTSSILAKEAELEQLATAAENDGCRLPRIYEQISCLRIEPEQKTRLLDECLALIETDAAAQQFRMELTEADRQFLSMLQQKHPSLSKKELRLCLLIKLRYNTKEIARETGFSVRGMETNRYRLHSKLGLKKHQSMKQYFASFQA